MNTKIKFEWEQLDDWNSRVRVIGGWLIKATEDVAHNLSAEARGIESGWDFRLAITFIPDPKHEWEIL